MVCARLSSSQESITEAAFQSGFSWHQDSGYVKWYDPTTQHKPYVTCWCTLDDVSEENGTVYILPHSRGRHAGQDH